MANEREILERSRQLEAGLRELGGQKPPSQQEEAMLKELLEIRILDLTSNANMSRLEAIGQAYDEQLRYKALAKSRESIEEFNLLEKVKKELLEVALAEEAQGTQKEKKKEEEEEKEEEEKNEDVGPSTNFGPASGAHNNGPPPTASDLADSSKTHTININIFQVTHTQNTPNPQQDKNGLAISQFLRADVQSAGVHREMKLRLLPAPTLPPNATPEQEAKHKSDMAQYQKDKETFSKAAEKAYSNAAEGEKEGYSLLSNNCVKACAKMLNHLDPSKFSQDTSMPWSLDAQMANANVQTWIADAKAGILGNDNKARQSLNPEEPGQEMQPIVPNPPKKEEEKEEEISLADTIVGKQLQGEGEPQKEGSGEDGPDGPEMDMEELKKRMRKQDEEEIKGMFLAQQKFEELQEKGLIPKDSQLINNKIYTPEQLKELNKQMDQKSADYEAKQDAMVEKYKNKEPEPAKADGKNITDANGEKHDVKAAEQAEEEQQKNTAAVPRPPTPGQQSD